MNSYNKQKALLSLSNIQKSFSSLKVLEKIDLTLYEGELVTILGPSDCGKSTIFDIISGIIKEDAGEVQVNASLGYMQQKDLLLPWKSIEDNIALPLIIQKESEDKISKKLKEYIPIAGLEGFEKHYPDQLSGGMRQRASFLRTLMASEDIMLLDEAFASLDSITKSKMHEWLLSILSNLGSSILAITHDIDEAILLSDRIYLLSEKPALVKKEFILDFNQDNKLERRFSEKTLELKKEILSLL